MTSGNAATSERPQCERSSTPGPLHANARKPSCFSSKFHPFAGEDKLEVIVAQEAPRAYVVRCAECGAQGPDDNAKPEHAVFAWNQRLGRLSLVK
jgi:hypothetical protein